MLRTVITTHQDQVVASSLLRSYCSLGRLDFAEEIVQTLTSWRAVRSGKGSGGGRRGSGGKEEEEEEEEEERSEVEQSDVRTDLPSIHRSYTL